MVMAAQQPGKNAEPRPPMRPPLRPRELEDGLNYYLYHPLAWRLARLLAHTPLTPNMVSVMGAGCVIGAAYAYFLAFPPHPGWPLAAALGMALHMFWHVVDGADGDLARITGKSSPIGEMVDGICDYTGHVVLYLVLGWLLSRQIGGWGWVLMGLAGASHIAQTNHVEVQKRSYQWWVYDRVWLGNTHKDKAAATRKGIFAAFAGFYLGVAGWFSGGAKIIDAAVTAAANDPARRERIRSLARTQAPPLLALLKWLGPNPRAIVLGLSMLAGSPLWYFLYLIIALNALLGWSVHVHNAAARRLLAALDQG